MFYCVVCYRSSCDSFHRFAMGVVGNGVVPGIVVPGNCGLGVVGRVGPGGLGVGRDDPSDDPSDNPPCVGWADPPDVPSDDHPFLFSGTSWIGPYPRCVGWDVGSDDPPKDDHPFLFSGTSWIGPYPRYRVRIR